MRLRSIRAAVAATALVFASAAPALAQYGGSDSPKTQAVRVVLTFNPAQTFTIDATTREDFILVFSGFLRNSTVQFAAQSDPVDLGTFQADANGVVTARLSIPGGVPAGNHDIVATGTDPAGNPLVLRQPILLAETVSAPSSLSLTGSDARGIAAVGGVLLVMGAAATIATRRRLGAQD